MIVWTMVIYAPPRRAAGMRRTIRPGGRDFVQYYRHAAGEGRHVGSANYKARLDLQVSLATAAKVCGSAREYQGERRGGGAQPRGFGALAKTLHRLFYRLSPIARRLTVWREAATVAQSRRGWSSTR